MLKLKGLLISLCLLSSSLVMARIDKIVSPSSRIAYEVDYNSARYNRVPLDAQALDKEFKKLFTNPNWYRRHKLANNATFQLPLKNPDLKASVKINLHDLQQVVHNYYEKVLEEIGSRQYENFWSDWKNKFEWHQVSTEKDEVIASLDEILKEQTASLTGHKTLYMLMSGAIVLAAAGYAGYHYREPIKAFFETQYEKVDMQAARLWVADRMPNLPSWKKVAEEAADAPLAE